jgi:hypothetical protein
MYLVFSEITRNSTNESTIEPGLIDFGFNFDLESVIMSGFVFVSLEILP